MPQEQVNEELRLFLEKHGKEMSNEEDINEKQGLNFYQDNRMDEIMEGNYQDEMLNKDGEDDLLM